VRVLIEGNMPILTGTTATIQSSFTGVAAVQLAGGTKGAAPITVLGRDGAPVIPTRRSDLGELLSSAPLLMERLGALTGRLANVFSDKNQKQMETILANTSRMTGTLADVAPQTQQVMSDLQVTLQEATVTLTEFQKLAAMTNAQLDPAGNSVMHQMRDTLHSAQVAADALKATVADANPAARRLNAETIPQAEAAIRELRATSKALRELTEKIDNQGAAAALGAPKLPEYHP
jgi:phospholipid/cholesterol/gamma-HCH transport system substrate-binding protein